MAVVVTSLGFGKAWKPPVKNNGASRIAMTWLPTRMAPIAAIDAYSRRMGRLLPGHASERHGPGDLLDVHFHDCAFRGPRHIDDVFVELRDSITLLSDVLDHELVDFAFDERRFLDFRRFLHRFHGSARSARVALEHRDAAFLHEPSVGSAALLAQDVRLDVRLDPVLDLLAPDLALEHDPTAFERPGGPELPKEIRQDHVRVSPDRADDVLEVSEDCRLALNHDVGRRHLEPLAAAQGRRQRFFRAGKELFVTERRHERRSVPGSL